jgi:tRNA threonylcarbamoyladenosine biosynthesis protein TsaB
MRVLGIETSSRRGSIALFESGNPVITLCHEELNAHAERLLPLIERALDQAGWSRGAIERVAVGVGPGSFTGLRVGIALGQGIAVGLGIELVGVGSLRAMAAAVPESRPGTRWAVLDARRGELFAAAYDPAGVELSAPRTVEPAALGPLIDSVSPSAPRVLVGEVMDVLNVEGVDAFRSPEADLPHATQVALLGATAAPAEAGVEPLYVRDAGAKLPGQL